jgi:hypothetical protein
MHLAVDLTDEICPEERCSVFSDGVVRYSDRNHMSASFAASLAPALEAKLRLWALRSRPPIARIFGGDSSPAR